MMPEDLKDRLGRLLSSGAEPRPLEFPPPGRDDPFWHRASRAAMLSMGFLLPLAGCVPAYGPALGNAALELGALILALSWGQERLRRGRWELPVRALPALIPAALFSAWLALESFRSTFPWPLLPGLLLQFLCLIAYGVVLLDHGGYEDASRLSGWILGAAWLAGLQGSLIPLCLPLALARVLDPEKGAGAKAAALGLIPLICANALASRDGLAALALQGLAFSAAAFLFVPSKAARLYALGAALAALGGLAAGDLAGLRISPGPDPIGAGLSAVLIASLLTISARAGRVLASRAALGESVYLAGFFGAVLGCSLERALGIGSPDSTAGLVFWLAAGMLGGLSLLAERGTSIVIPFPQARSAGRWVQGPALALGCGLAAFPLLWLASDVHYAIARSRAELAEWKEAIGHAEEVFPGSASYAAAFHLKANAYLQWGKPEEALRECRVLESVAPGYEDVDSIKGRAYAELKDYQNALASFERHARLHPGDPAAWAGLAQAALAAKELSRARQASFSALALEPKNPDHWQRLSLIYRLEKKIIASRRMSREASRLRAEGG